MRLVPIQSVKEDSYLAKTIYDDNGRVLLKEGVKLTSPMIRRIEGMQMYSLYINDEYSDSIIEDVIQPELRQKAIKTIKSKFYSLESSIKDSSYNSFENYKKREEEFQSVAYVVKEIMDEILSNKDVMLNLVDIKSLSNYTFQHCVNVTIIALVIGIKLNLHKFDLIDLCTGALLHDIGNVFVPRQILEKQGELTEAELNIVKQHPRKGYEYLRESYSLSVTAILVVLQHHERVSGQGYPEGRVGEKISKFAKIVAIADVYDALTSDRSYRRAMSPNEALEYIMASGGTQFDYKMVQVFSKAVIPYAEGTMVKLSTGDIGVVDKVYPSLTLRPDVKIIHSSNPKKINTVIRLAEEINIVIEGIQNEIPK